MIPDLTRRRDTVVALGWGKSHDDKKRIDSMYELLNSMYELKER